MKIVRFSLEVKYRAPKIWLPSNSFNESIEDVLRNKYSDIECINDNLEYKKHNECIWGKIKDGSIKNLYKEEQLIASYDKRKINYFIFRNDLGRKYKKESSFDILIIARKNRSIDLVVNQVISHIKRKMWFMKIDIIKDSGVNIYFEKKVEDMCKLKSVTADIIENDKTTIVERLSTWGLFIVGIILTCIGLKLEEGDLKTIILSIGASELAVIVGLILTHIAKLWNKTVKISIIDAGSFVEDENIISENGSPFEPDKSEYSSIVTPNKNSNEEKYFDNKYSGNNRNKDVYEQEVDLNNPIAN